MFDDNLIDSILSAWGRKSESGIIGVNNVDSLHELLTSMNFPDDIILEVVNSYESVINELTVRDDGGKRDKTLALKDTFVSQLKRINPEWHVSVGDVIERLSDDRDGIKIRISSSSLSNASESGDTIWSISSLPEAVFYIDFGTNVNGLLKRESSKTGKLQSTDTEALHECFFVIDLALQIDSRGAAAGIRDANDLNSLIQLMKSTRISIHDVEKIQSVFQSRVSRENFSSEVNLRKSDAHYCAKAAYDKLKEIYGDNEFKYVARVFETLDGKKVVADALVNVGGETLSISLKYGKGQLNNISSNLVLKNLFGISFDAKSSFMDALYAFDGSSLDKLLRYFIHGINKILPPKDKKNYLDPTKITYPEFKKSRNNYYSLAYSTISSELIKSDESAVKYATNYRKLKSELLAKTIERYIDSKKTDNVDFLSFLYTTLRCESDRSYMYVGNRGRSIYVIPSKQSLQQIKLDIKVEPKQDTSDYSAKIEVFANDTLAFEFEINFRWTQSQWSGELAQASKNLKAYEMNWL